MLRGHKTETPYHGLRNQIRQSRCSEAPCDPGVNFRASSTHFPQQHQALEPTAAWQLTPWGFGVVFVQRSCGGSGNPGFSLPAPKLRISAGRGWGWWLILGARGMLQRPRCCQGIFHVLPLCLSAPKALLWFFDQNRIHQMSFSEVSEAFESVQTPLLFFFFYRGNR